MARKLVSRRTIVKTGLLGAGVFATASMTGLTGIFGAEAQAKGKFKINRTPEEWKKRLGSAKYRILRQEGTERPYSSPLNNEKRKGVYACAGCNLGLYKSETKYDSGTGWPSFWAPIKGRVGTSTDYKIGYRRTEVHCGRCGGHQGHIFSDGPRPTGERHCINGLALRFIPT